MTPSIRAYCRRHRITMHSHGTFYTRHGRTLYSTPIGWILTETWPAKTCPHTQLQVGDVDRILGCHPTLQSGLAALAGVQVSHQSAPAAAI